MGNKQSQRQQPLPEGALSTKVNNMNLKSKSTNVMEQKLKNAKATGVLSLRESKLRAIPEQVLSIEKLHTLDLHANAIKVIPPEIATLAKIKTLHLHDNSISEIPNLEPLVRLQTLSLDGNKLCFLNNLPATKLKKLALSRNLFREFPAAIIALTSCLQELDLSGNEIELLPPEICTFQCLRELHLDHNRLIMLPDEIGQLAKLRTLFVRGNKLQTLPAGFLKTTLVDKMQLEGNLFTKKQFMAFDGFEEFETRRTALKMKGDGVGGRDLCGLDDS